jgi:hypothetical protein
MLSLIQKWPGQLWGPPSLLFNGYWGSFPQAKELEHEVTHLPPSSTKVKNERRNTSAPLINICLHGLDGEGLPTQ